MTDLPIRWLSIGAAVVLIVAGLVVRPGDGDGDAHHVAMFADASELVGRNSVRLNDVQVGKVTSVSLDGLHARVAFSVARDVHLPAGTRAEIRQTSLLGELYVALVPEGSGRLRDGAVIPMARTRRASGLEEVVALGSQLVNEVSADNINRLVASFDDAFGGHPERVTRLFDSMAAASGTLASQRDALAATIDRVEQMAAGLAPHTQELAGSVRNLASGLRALASQRDNLDEFTTGLRKVSDSASELLVRNEAKLAAAGKQSRQLLGEVVGELDNLEKGLKAIPDFNLGWNCTVQGHWIQELQAVYPEAARIDAGAGHCDPAKGSRGREESGQVQVSGVPQPPPVDVSPTGGRPAPGPDGGLGAFMWSMTGKPRP